MTSRHNAFSSCNSLEATCDAVLLGRLGRELANVYADGLHSPLPPALQAIVDRLDDAFRSMGAEQQTSTATLS